MITEWILLKVDTIVASFNRSKVGARATFKRLKVAANYYLHEILYDNRMDALLSDLILPLPTTLCMEFCAEKRFCTIPLGVRCCYVDCNFFSMY